jgi:hypothetical protein
MKMKYLHVLIITYLYFTPVLYAETEFYSKTDFERGDVVTVLITDAEEFFTLELIDSENRQISTNIFFPLDTIDFKGYAALIGLDSTLSRGSYRLIIKNSIGTVVFSKEIEVHENVFKKEQIALNYNNSALRTNTDPEIINQARNIHKIYGSSRQLINSLGVISSFSSPLESGIITSWYGDRRIFQYSDGSSDNSIHNGIDYAAPFGTRIHAAASGRVVFVGERIITGNSVVIEYIPGVYGVFFHLNEIFVSKNELVSGETVIGSLGSSGLATGPHLHWELRVGGVPVNPNPYLEDGLIDKSLIMSIVSTHTAE